MSSDLWRDRAAIAAIAAILKMLARLRAADIKNPFAGNGPGRLEARLSGAPLDDERDALGGEAYTAGAIAAVEPPEEGAGRDTGHDLPIEHRLHRTVGRVRNARDGKDIPFCLPGWASTARSVPRGAQTDPRH